MFSKIEKVPESNRLTCNNCGKISNKESSDREVAVGDLYMLPIGSGYSILCKNCLMRLKQLINDAIKDGM